MNYLIFPTFIMAVIIFRLGMLAGSHKQSWMLQFLLYCTGIFAAFPGTIFAAYYFKVFGEPVWLYKFRSFPYTELTASGTGFLAGLLHEEFSSNVKFRRIAGRWFFPGLMVMGLSIPYAKPLVRRPNWNQFQDKWSDGVCLQSSEFSCGPACAATLLYSFGKPGNEEQIARSSYTSRSGTENWYLARTLRKCGLKVQFIYNSNTNEPWPFPAIAGVRVPSASNSGHFITLLDRVGDKYVIGDPLEGRTLQSKSELANSYEITGFFMVVH
jgi:hypothetical protein